MIVAAAIEVIHIVTMVGLGTYFTRPSLNQFREDEKKQRKQQFASGLV